MKLLSAKVYLIVKWSRFHFVKSLGSSPRRRRLGATPACRVLSPQARTQRGLPREVSRWIENSVPAEEAFLRGLVKRAGATALVRAISAHAAPPSLGGRCPQAVRRTRARVALSGALYPSRRHLQSPAD